MTGDALLQKKAYQKYIENFETRAKSAYNFLKQLYPSVKIEIFELLDPIGIAGTSTNLDALILTRETAKGGQMVNDKRAENKLEPLNLVFVDMVLASVSEAGANNFSNKTSSSYIR